MIGNICISVTSKPAEDVPINDELTKSTNASVILEQEFEYINKEINTMLITPRGRVHREHTEAMVAYRATLIYGT